MFNKFIPSYAYTITTDGDSDLLKRVKKRIKKVGAKFTADSEMSFSAIVSSNSFAIAMHPFWNDLRLDCRVENGRVNLTVTRAKERAASIFLLVFTVLISIAIFVQKNDPQAAIFPVGAYVGLYLNSLMAFHPAHAKIRKLLYYLDEI